MTSHVSDFDFSQIQTMDQDELIQRTAGFDQVLRFMRGECTAFQQGSTSGVAEEALTNRCGGRYKTTPIGGHITSR